MQYRQSQHSLQIVITQEVRVRNELTTLRQHRKTARDLELTDEPEMRGMGADVIWEKWLEKSTIKLNIDLAKILATKEIHIARVRNSFGKLQAADANLKHLQTIRKQRKGKWDLDRTISQTLGSGF